MFPGLGRSPGEGKGYPLQYSDLENSMDCKFQEVAKGQTGLSDLDLATFSGCEVFRPTARKPEGHILVDIKESLFTPPAFEHPILTFFRSYM